ncbi:MAG: hypothetical protein ACM3Q4_01155 [Acidobacteriota bacterium]
MHPLLRCMLFGLLIAACTAHEAFSLPRFSARTGERCQSCHVNPMGRGIRTPSGAAFGRDDLPVPAWKDAVDFDSIGTSIAPTISIGTDVRTLYFYNESDKTGSFFQMEGNLYLDFRLNRKLRLSFSKGLYQGFELFALARVLPAQGWIKAGKFVPAYGVRIDDHNAFIRGGRYSGAFFRAIPPGYPQGLRFGERAEDTGVEVGLAPSIFTLSAGLFNGTPGGGLTGTSGLKHYAAVLRGDALIDMGPANLTVGGSFYNSPNNDVPGKTQFYGGFGMLGIGASLVLIGEVDWLVSHVIDKEATGRMVYSEVDYTIVDGFELTAGYEFYDPDVSLGNGTVSSVNIGASFYPLSGVELRPFYRINREHPTEITNNEFSVQMHFFF